MTIIRVIETARSSKKKINVNRLLEKNITHAQKKKFISVMEKSYAFVEE